MSKTATINKPISYISIGVLGLPPGPDPPVPPGGPGGAAYKKIPINVMISE